MGGISIFVCARFTHLQMVQKKCIIKHGLDTTNKMMLEEEMEATREKLNTLMLIKKVITLFAWDTFFLDWVLFVNIKKIRLPGTEHMDKEYHQKWFHVKGCIPMIPVFAGIGVLSSLLVLWIW